MGLTEIRVAHSPDSDDAFMFCALATGKLDTGDFRFTHTLEDIESLSQKALHGVCEVTAVSIHAYAYISERYALLLDRAREAGAIPARPLVDIID
jgi:1,4-dihydroxy-6-naphthoate synthase